MWKWSSGGVSAWVAKLQSNVSLYSWQRMILNTTGNRIVVGGRQVGRTTVMLMDAIYRAAHGSQVHIVVNDMGRVSMLYQMAVMMSTHLIHSYRSYAIEYDSGRLNIWSALPTGLHPDYLYTDEVPYGELNELYDRILQGSTNIWVNLRCQGDDWTYPMDLLRSASVMKVVSTDEWEII